MKVRVKNIFTTVRSEGAMLPMDLLQRVVENDKNLGGLTPTDYHLLEDEKLNEAINRAWSRLRGAWVSFQGALEKLPEGDVATTVTRDRFLLPLFQELGYGRLTVAKSLEVGDRSFPISHTWQNTLIHLVGFGVELDKRTKGVAGAARSSPHSLVQECLNRSDEHLWAFVSNGKRLRILRDNASLTRQAYVEFDLEAMMAGEVYADFVLLWLLCHQSRVEGEKPEKCWLERWSKAANDQGKRALEDLRGGVQTAIERLGQGFLVHPENKALKDKLYSGELNTQDYYRQLLRLVYRLLFLFVAEDRDLLLDPQADEAAKDRYRLYYSTVKLRALSERRRGSRHSDLFQGLRLVMEKLGSAEGCPAIGLPALGSFLWSSEAVLDLLGSQTKAQSADDRMAQLSLDSEDLDNEKTVEPCQISNADFLDAVRALAFITDKHGRRPVDYKNLQSEELGSVYESLLELHPELNRDAGTFVLEAASGNERKTTGSYYTPESLVQCLLDSALDPVLEEAALRPDAEAAILALKVCDPACGSGHFLIAAAHRIAKRLAFVRTGDEEPSPMEVQRALRDVIGRCMYGVDINSMAVELCKVALWMEALEPGKPLSFLDHHIQCGNSLIGATPALLRKGIPDSAFKPIPGDDKEYCKKFRQQNKEERIGQMKLFDPERDNISWQQLDNLASGITHLDNISDENIDGVQRKRNQYETMVRSRPYLYSRFCADAWCAAFLWQKTDKFVYPITENIFRQLERNPHDVDKHIRDGIEQLSHEHKLFHWHLAFPDVFYIEDSSEKDKPNEEVFDIPLKGGFDIVIGNPPWEKLQTEEVQFFSTRNPNISKLKGSQRKTAIQDLRITDPILADDWVSQKRLDASAINFIRNSDCYPLTGVGKFNTFALFSELNSKILSESGCFGCIVPSGIATDNTTKLFFQSLVKNNSLISLYDFENREKIFPTVDSRYKFCLLTVNGSTRSLAKTSEFVFFALKPEDLGNHNKKFTLNSRDISNLNPNTLTCPTFRWKQDAEINREIYNRIPIFFKKSEDVINPYAPKVWRLLNTTDDSSDFLKLNEIDEEGSLVPVIEAKMIHQFDHRYSTYRRTGQLDSAIVEIPALDKVDPTHTSNAKFYIDEPYFRERLPREYRQKSWFFTARNIARSTDERTVISAILPRAASCEVTPYIEVSNGPKSAAFLCGVLNSFVLDYTARQKVGGTHLSYFILYQLPVLPPVQAEPFSITFFLNRVLELTYTAWDIQAFAQDCEYDGPPFHWEEGRRFILRCELDAAYFHLYKIQRADVDYIMETFPIVKRKDEKEHGHYRTKTTILEIYDEMTAAIESGQPYQTLLDPPPADPSLAHPPLEIAD